MDIKAICIKRLPPFKYQKELLIRRQNTDDIVNEILFTHLEFENDYDLIYDLFGTGRVNSTCNKIWSFLKYNLVYDAEGGKDQSVKSPAAILHPGEQIDCKHYALFAGGILDALKRNEDESWDWCYRFASDKTRNDLSHVFVVVTVPTRGLKPDEIWIDPCLNTFDYKKSYLVEQDEKPMALYKISGVGDIIPASKPKTIIVNNDVAWTSFLYMVNENLLQIRFLMKQNLNITNGPVKDFLLSQGFDWDQFQNFLNAK